MNNKHQKPSSYDKKLQEVKQALQQFSKDLEQFEQKQKHKQEREQYEQTLQPAKAKNNKIKLLVTEINHSKAHKLYELTHQFYCDVVTQEKEGLIIVKNEQLTDNEFSALAGKLVMVGLKVVLI